MTIKTKHDLKEILFTMDKNKIIKLRVREIKYSSSFNKGVTYVCHSRAHRFCGEYRENEIFKTKEELTDFLVKECNEKDPKDD